MQHQKPCFQLFEATLEASILFVLHCSLITFFTDYHLCLLSTVDMASSKKIGCPLGSKDGPKDPNTGPHGQPRLHVEEGVLLLFLW